MTQPARRSSEQPPPQPHQKPKRRWFQFGMRSLFIVMTLVCVGLGWLIHHVRQREAVVLMIEELGGEIGFGEPSFLGRMAVVRSLFGEQAFVPITDVYLGERTTNEHLVQLPKLTELKSLSLDRTQVTDLSPLAGMKELTHINFSNTPVSDLSPLAGLKGLTWLDLSNTQVSDLSPLAGMKELDWLDLRNTQVSDLSSLAGLKNLQVIFLQQDQKVLIPASLETAVRRF